MARGKFITLEGGEGSGKSTQAAILARLLEAASVDVMVTREPGGTEGAEQIRDLLVNGSVDRWQPMAEALLHTAARVEHVETAIRPALAQGTWVICDRFADSTCAYQGGGHGLGLEAIDAITRDALGSFIPDLTFVLDIPVKEGLARAFGRSDAEDRYERMDVDFHHRIRDTFITIAEKEPERCRVIDANRPVQAVEADIRAAVIQRFDLTLPDHS
ncbi:MAG: dTMP kinase [Rhodospirillaceae bacterium]